MESKPKFAAFIDWANWVLSLTQWKTFFLGIFNGKFVLTLQKRLVTEKLCHKA